MILLLLGLIAGFALGTGITVWISRGSRCPVHGVELYYWGNGKEYCPVVGCKE